MRLFYSVICLIGLGSLAAADCCSPFQGGCDDGTSATPCCGKGKCNIFCCNCDGGCRRHTTSFAAASEPPQVQLRKAPSDACSYDTTFDAVSGVGSEIINLADYLVWATSYQPSSVNNASELNAWIQYFHSFDKNGDGRLTLDEIHQPMASKRKDL